MADITAELLIERDWTEITGAGGFGFTDGESYVLDIVGSDTNATVYYAETDTTDEPTVIGHPWRSGDRNTPIDPRLIEYATGTYAWLRVDRGTATIVATVK